MMTMRYLSCVIVKITTVLQVSLVVMNRRSQGETQNVVKGYLKSKIGVLKYGNGRNNQKGWEAEEDRDYRELINQPVSQSVNQLVSQSISHSVNQSLSQLASQSVDQLVSQSISQSVTSQSVRRYQNNYQKITFLYIFHTT